jgi:hypothetical protein
MAFKIPKLLSANIDITGTNATWVGSELNGVAYRWDATIAVDTQTLSAPTDNTYDGTDVNVGDFVASTNRGECLEIIAISAQNAGEVTCILEDRERLNSYADTGQTGDGSVPDGRGIIFESQEGVPILFPLPSSFPAELNPAFVDQIINRFKYRREDRTVLVKQSGHGFQVKDIITINSSGIYSKVDLSASYDNLIGFVTEVDHPDTTFFRFQTQQMSLDYALTGDVGSIHYVDPDTAGGTTNTIPLTSLAIPAFIKLSATKAVPVFSGPSSVEFNTASSAGAWVVDTYTELISITAVHGDIAYVKNTNTDNEFIVYMYIDSAWQIISHKDVQHTDARSVSYSFTGNTASGATIATVGENARVTDMVIDVTQVFNSGADLTIGTIGDADLISTSGDVDLSITGKYHIVSNYKFAESTESDLIVTFNNGGGSGGAATIVMSYV